jgi:hypothetical protein
MEAAASQVAVESDNKPVQVNDESREPKQKWYARLRKRSGRSTTFAQDHQGTTEVMLEGMWFMSVFILTHFWSTTSRIVQQFSNGQTTYFALTLLHSWFDPL